ncbi:hypothetical protein tinsulaeT_37420 [Thalassotalea insulae]|uniref:histidine kinase n=2 Tax=Thalassotalea insulae TaxID=2056778 RepID=A0ABQ6H0Q4_9GAMM|nr:hypothetical protein tinsulaeT_37420 [Thalassotalea insulae]
MFWYVKKLNLDLVRSTTQSSAAQYINLLTEFRTLYSSEVVATAARQGLEITHDYHDKTGAIPLPATLSMLLIDKLSEHGDQVKAKLYSAYPFPWRQQTGGLNGEFERQAWQSFQQTPKQAFTQIEMVNGVLSLRYAVADVMRPACISCHNSHPDTPKNDWQVGDIRGVLEVIQPLEHGVSKVNNIFWQMVGLISALLLFSALAVLFILRQMQQRQSQLSDLNMQLTTEISAKQQATEQLQLAMDEAIAANKSKSAFLANISHEIRTPMNAILGYTQILQRDTDLSGDQQHSLSVIEHSGEHLLGIINDVLDLSKIEANAVTLNKQVFDLELMFITLSDMFRLKAQQKQLEWQTVNNIASQKLSVLGDQGKLRQVLINLIGNAIKFTDNGQVCFTLTPQANNYFHFEIADTGPGIAPEYQQKIFNAFNQGNLQEGLGGTGLGLTISKKYLSLMACDLHLESELAQGAKFYFDIQLPVVEAELGANDDWQVKQLRADQSKSILVVDDIEVNRIILTRMLSDVGFTVYQAEHGQTALNLMSQHKIDLVFTDMMMPEMAGDQLLKQIITNYPDVLVVAVSASSMHFDEEYFVDLGFNGFIAKPFHFEDVYQTLKQLLHIEYDYQNKVGSLQANSDLIHLHELAQYCQPQMKTLLQYCQLYQITEIEQFLTSLKEEKPELSPLVQYLSEFVYSYDMDAMLEFLQSVMDDG